MVETARAQKLDVYKRQGWNRVTSTNDPTAHAEVTAIRAACKKLQTFQLADCELYTSCEPCPMCLAAIYWARFQKVFYANTRRDAARIEFDDDLIYREVARPVGHRKIPMKPVSYTHLLISKRDLPESKLILPGMVMSSPDEVVD